MMDTLIIRGVFCLWDDRIVPFTRSDKGRDFFFIGAMVYF
jgi:hypothetical protein